MPPMDTTLSKSGRAGGGRRAGGAGACLHLALDCDRPLSRPTRHDLRGVEVVTLARAAGHPPDPPAGAAARHLAIVLDDPRTSAPHARLARVHGRWVVEDLRSKNGLLINGRRVASAALEDGDVLELGHTLLLFRAPPAAVGAVPAGEQASREPPHPDLETLVPSLADSFDALARVAPSDAPVLVAGETGTGKELLARAVHDLSRRRGAFVAVNCGGLPPTLVESELFGVHRGAFSGATENRPGLIRASDGGTLFLDEVGDLPLPAQAALLRVLSSSEVLPVGDTRAVRVDLRVVSASHRDLEAMMAKGEFRPDLFARLAGFRIALPPLRDRREDLGLLVPLILRRVGGERAGRVRLTCEAGVALLRHAWPLNVRELEKVLAVATALAGDGPVGLEHLPEAVQRAARPAGPEAVEPLGPADSARREELVSLLTEHQGNVAAVARALGKARMQVHRWLKRYGIRVASFRR